MATPGRWRTTLFALRASVEHRGAPGGMTPQDTATDGDHLLVRLHPGVENSRARILAGTWWLSDAGEAHGVFGLGEPQGGSELVVDVGRAAQPVDRDHLGPLEPRQQVGLGLAVDAGGERTLALEIPGRQDLEQPLARHG